VRPRRLRIKNFGCFRGEHEVDFTGLASDLFAITGPTGSGKSTVLDALTWALYGQTPRLGKHLNEHIFSPGESELSVVVEFEAGGSEYRATRALRRRRSGIAPSAKRSAAAGRASPRRRSSRGWPRAGAGSRSPSPTASASTSGR